MIALPRHHWQRVAGYGKKSFPTWTRTNCRDHCGCRTQPEETIVRTRAGRTGIKPEHNGHGPCMRMAESIRLRTRHGHRALLLHRAACTTETSVQGQSANSSRKKPTQNVREIYRTIALKNCAKTYFKRGSWQGPGTARGHQDHSRY